MGQFFLWTSKVWYMSWQMIHKQLLQTPLCIGLFLSLTGKMESASFQFCDISQKWQFFAGKNILHWKNMLFKVFLLNNSQNSKHLPQKIIFEQGTLFTSPKNGDWHHEFAKRVLLSWSLSGSQTFSYHHGWSLRTFSYGHVLPSALSMHPWQGRRHRMTQYGSKGQSG
jgi:hypothetical protein